MLTSTLRATAALVAALALALAGCGDDDEPTVGTGDGDMPPPATELDLVNAGRLTVCTDAPYQPFEFQDDDGEWTGFDMDLMRAIAERLDLDLEVTVQPFDGIWLAPAAGTCDIVASAMTITEERQEQALFSDPYFDADQSLLVRAEDEERYATLDDLAGATIGVQTGTTGEDYAEENTPDGATVRSFDEAGAMFLALDSGDIDAILQDFPVNAYRATQDDSFVVTDTFPTGEQYGFATSEDNETLIEAVNEQLDALRESGEYDRIFEKWFGEAPDEQ